MNVQDITQLKNSRLSRLDGMTLVEVMIYTALLSFLMSGFIQFAYSLHVSDLQLTDQIND